MLGEGVYTNDHAAQLYWADWLQHGFGPEPSAVRFGYPIGPQAVAVIAAQVTGATLVSAFNGLLLAIPVLTALTALGGLRGAAGGAAGSRSRRSSACLTWPPRSSPRAPSRRPRWRCFVLAFALALARARRAREDADDAAAARGARSSASACCSPSPSVFTFSAPGPRLVRHRAAALARDRGARGRSPVDWRRSATAVLAHVAGSWPGRSILIAIAVLAFGPASEFVNKIADVQESAGRLSSPVFPGEALGIWPQGDFRIVRGEVSGSLIAVALGALAVAVRRRRAGPRRRQSALLAMLLTGGIVYLGTRALRADPRRRRRR